MILCLTTLEMYGVWRDNIGNVILMHSIRKFVFEGVDVGEGLTFSEL